MTLEGSIVQLQDLIDSDGIPFWAKPSLRKVMETVEMEREERKNAVCGKCAFYDSRFSYCDRLGVTFADDDFCSYFKQKEVDE